MEKSFKKASADDDEYISYNNYLESNYNTNISDNEDYIAQLVGNSALIVLKDGYFDRTEEFDNLINEILLLGEDALETDIEKICNKVDLKELNNVFEILNDKLGERCYEKNNYREWSSAGR